MSDPRERDLLFADEMRVGLHDEARRRWCPRWVTLVQPVEIAYLWRYLVLAVAPAGKLRWAWRTGFRKEPIAKTLTAWSDEGVDPVIWEYAPAHKTKLVRADGVPLSPLPSYAPELNPVERVFEEPRRTIEGQVSREFVIKVLAVECILQQFATDPMRVRRLAGWTRITGAVASASYFQPGTDYRITHR